VTSPEFIVEFDTSFAGRQSLIDTGNDSLFLWFNSDVSWDTNPRTVALHKHSEVDETVVMLSGEGYFLHGREQTTIVKSKWKAPCLLWMPADQYHRIVVTSEERAQSILIYSPSKTPLDTFTNIIGRAVTGVEVIFNDLPEESISREIFDHVPSSMIRVPS